MAESWRRAISNGDGGELELMLGAGSESLGSMRFGVVIVLVACARAPVTPLQNAAEVVVEEGPLVDEAEWGLLNGVVKDVAGGEGALASFYERYGAWDEYAAVRSRMMERAGRGSPFPRIGAPRTGVAPRTVLARWINRAVLPELFAEDEMTLGELEKVLVEALRAAPPGYEATPHVRVGDVLCARLRFAEAARHYDFALAARRPPYEPARARARRDDVRRILRPGADHIVGNAGRGH